VKKNKEKTYVELPPAAFSNAIIFIYKDWDNWENWETSPEWKMFNAGRSDAFRGIALMTQASADECRKVVLP
jgi:hypothetical protein